METAFNKFCESKGIPQSENNSDLLGFEPTVEEYYYSHFEAFNEGGKKYREVLEDILNHIENDLISLESSGYLLGQIEKVLK